MFNTEYNGITTISRNGMFFGGFCKFWYTPIENIQEWPAINPLTQEYEGEPVLKTGTVWFGPVNVPDSKLGFDEKPEETAAGIFWKLKLELFQPGDERSNRSNKLNMLRHKYVAVGQSRSGGMFLLIGTPESPLTASLEYKSGKGANDTAGATFYFTTESKTPAIPLPSFNGEDSLPSSSNNPELTLPVINRATKSIEYTGNGTEGTTITFTELIGKIILMIVQGDKILVRTTAEPDNANQFRINDGTGKIDFGTEIENLQRLLILYK